MPSSPSPLFTMPAPNFKEVPLTINAYLADGVKGHIIRMCIRSKNTKTVCVSRPYKNPAYIDEEKTPNIHKYSFTSVRTVKIQSSSRLYTYHLHKAREFLAKYYAEQARKLQSRVDGLWALSTDAENIEPQEIR